MDNRLPDFPLGLGMSLLMNERAGGNYGSLSETEKEHIILKCKDAKTKEEMDKIIDSLSPAERFDELFQEPGVK